MQNQKLMDGTARYHGSYMELLRIVQRSENVATWAEGVHTLLNTPTLQFYNAELGPQDDDNNWVTDQSSRLGAINLVAVHADRLVYDPAPQNSQHTVLDARLQAYNLGKQLYEYAYAGSNVVGKHEDALMPTNNPGAFLVLHPIVVHHPITHERQHYVTVRRGKSVLY